MITAILLAATVRGLIALWGDAGRGRARLAAWLQLQRDRLARRRERVERSRKRLTEETIAELVQALRLRDQEVAELRLVSVSTSTLPSHLLTE